MNWLSNEKLINYVKLICGSEKKLELEIERDGGRERMNNKINIKQIEKD